VQAALAHGLDEPGQRGKHIALDQDREQQIFDWMEQNANETRQSREQKSRMNQSKQRVARKKGSGRK
jgi:hypothetical protein